MAASYASRKAWCVGFAAVLYVCDVADDRLDTQQLLA